ncbi:fructosamine kinase family protein [Roseovarius salinarum]|uniref:fructosamine kinase family protein n=1 Tax=Roseovarius salinarum TaxID=1981892 RepID=UPI000C32A714|nr:fructosamine kinase family protein [Roseovarius salinarum]
MSLAARIAAATGAQATALHPLHGGDLSDVYCAELADGRRMAAKTGPMVEAEARMLRTMRGAASAVPRVLHAEPGLILLDFLEETAPSAAGWRAAGEQLRALHAAPQDAPYGWTEDYAFGAAPVPNAEAADWPTFWRDRRLLAFADALPPEVARRLDRLGARLPDLLPATPPPALLHGDLWAGNLLFAQGRAWFIDPACYHGDAEVDLAMLTLFGNPPGAFWDGYGALTEGAADRRPVYQLWPALVHLRLFGAGYRGMVSGLLDRLGA